MVPTVFATGFSMFEGKQRAMIPAILGMVSVLAPTLGPTVGGWLTDAVGWRSIFYVNIAPGAIGHPAGADLHPRRPAELRHAEEDRLLAPGRDGGVPGRPGICAGGRPEHDWFSDPHIATGAWLSFVGFLLFLERSFRSGGPIVRLTPFRKPTFAFACVFNLVIGFGIYSSTYLVPVFLGRVRGYDCLQIGTTVFVAGIAQVLSTVIAARLSQVVDPRKVITVGLTLFAASLWLTSHGDAGLGLRAPSWGRRLLRGFCGDAVHRAQRGLALTGFVGPELRAASGLFNLMRNLGGAIGIAVVNTWLQDNARIQAARMGESLGRAGAPGAGRHRPARRPDRPRSTPDPVRAALLRAGRTRPRGRPLRADLRASRRCSR